MPVLTNQALLIFEGAFKRFRDTVTPEDAVAFQSTTLDDVRSSVLELERQLALRKSLKNFKRIQPLLDSLEYFSKTAEVLCNGTPFLPWVWAPIKLMLQLTSEVPYALERLITSYKQIAENLPRFDRLRATPAQDKTFQRVLAVFYEDVLEFHRRAYKFVRRRGWAVFFKSAWGQFDRRFKGILKDLATHTELVDKEATAAAIEQANDTRSRLLERIDKTEDEKLTEAFNAVLAWLDAARLDQEDEVDARTNNCHPGSCEWIFKNPKMKGWVSQAHVNSVLWLHGKPGSGKTMLCSQIINTIICEEEKLNENEKREKKTILYYFFSNDVSSNPNRNKCNSLLRSLAAQIIKANRELAIAIYDSFISQGALSTIKPLREVLKILLKACASTRIIIYGLDECSEKEAALVLKETLNLASCNAGPVFCKVLYSSRDVDPMSKSLVSKANISLGCEGEGLNAAINGFVKAKVDQLTSNLDGIELEEDFHSYLEQQLIDKANGMFLWVELVLAVLEESYSIDDMKTSIDTLPAGLEELYERILQRWKDRPNVATAYRILIWLTYAHRPVKKHELQLGIGIHSQATNSTVSERSRQSLKVFDLCKPLLEDGPNDTIRFVHTSVQQYLRKLEDPLISLRAGHYCIAFACIAYLDIGLDLIDPETAATNKYQALIKGFHALAVYATEHWSIHLLDYLRHMGPDTTGHKHRLLLERLQRMCNKHDRLADTFQVEEPSHPTNLPEDVEILEQLTVPPSVRSIVLKHLEIQQATFDQKKLGKNGVSEASVSTLFCTLQKTYYKMTRDLLDRDSYDGVDKSALLSFKQSLTGSCFCCRFRKCPRGIFGFENADDLKNHEASHVMQLLCKHEDCQYSKLPFTDPRTLKKHNDQFHPAKPPPIPQALQRLDTAATLVNNTDSDVPVLSLKEPDDEELPYNLPDLGLPVNGVKDLDVEKSDEFAINTTAW